MILQNLSNLNNTENILLCPMSNTKKYEILIIAKGAYLFPSLFQMETISGKIIIKTPSTKTKIKFSLGDILSIISNEEIEDSYLNNIRIQIISKYTGEKYRSMFINKKFAKMFYYPKTFYKEINMKNIFCCCCPTNSSEKILNEKSKRFKKSLEFLISESNLNELKDEIYKNVTYDNRFNNSDLSSGLCIPIYHYSKRKFLVFVNKSSSNYSDEILSKCLSFFTNSNITYDCNITMKKRDAYKKIKKIGIDSYEGIIACGGDGLVHEVINGILSRKDSKEFREKIPIGVIPCGKNNSIVCSIATESEEEILPESFAYIIAKGRVKEIDVQEAEMIREGKTTKQLYFISYLALLNSADFVNDYYRLTSKYSWLTKGNQLNTDFCYLPFCSSFSLSKIPSIIHRIEGLKEMCQAKGIYDFFLACNSKYINKKVKVAPQAKLNDGYCDLITMRNISKCQKFFFLNSYPINGDYFDDNNKLKTNLGVDYIKTNIFRLKPIIPNGKEIFYILDGERYPLSDMQVKTKNNLIKMFCFNK